MNTTLPTTIELPTDTLAEFIIFNAMEAGSTAVEMPEDIENEDDVLDGVTATNVTDIETDGLRIIVHGEFPVATIEEFHRATRWEPSYVTRGTRQMAFTAFYDIEDLGHAGYRVETI